MIRRPPRSTLFPTRRSSDLDLLSDAERAASRGMANTYKALAFLYVVQARAQLGAPVDVDRDRKSTRLNSSHGYISYAVFCLKKKKRTTIQALQTTRARTAHS